MASWTQYKGMDIPDTFTPSGNAGDKLANDLKTLANRDIYPSAGAPTTSDGANDGFIAGSLWLDTTTSIVWACVDPSNTSAVWRTLFKREAGALILCSGNGGTGSGERGLQLDSGGNARGDDAVDLQSGRSASTQVASGDNSVISGGKDNTAAGENAVVGGGFNNQASGDESVICGGNGNGSSYNHQVVCGGSGNLTGVGEFATIVGGTSNAVSGNAGFIGGGTSNHVTALADCGFVSGGRQGQASLPGQMAHAAGSFANSGDAQFTRAILRRATTNATATELTLDGSAPTSGNRFTIDDEHAYACVVRIAARKDSGSDQAFFIRQLIIQRTSGTVALQGSVQTIGTDINPAGWSISLGADDATGHKSLQIQVTGAASTNIRWVAVVEAVEIEY